MSVLFFAACILCILYCALYGAYSLADRHVCQAISVFVMTALAVGAMIVLIIAV